MHIFNMGGTCLQRIEKKYYRAEEELIWQTMHYQPLLYKQCSKDGFVKIAVNLSKIIFSASSFFMHIFNMCGTCLQSIKKKYWEP